MSWSDQILRWLPYVVAAWLFIVGLYGIVTSRHVVHLVISLSIAQSSTYVLLVSLGYLKGAGAPVFIDVGPGSRAVDPVVQALAFTDIVVSATVTALLLSIAVVLKSRGHSLDPRQFKPMHPVTHPSDPASR